MLCVNCRQEIDISASQCPFCHHNPHRPAYLDEGGRADRVAVPGVGAAVGLALAGLILAPVFPVVGVSFAVLGGAGAVDSLVRFWRGRRRL